jgi:hypothetical protein
MKKRACIEFRVDEYRGDFLSPDETAPFLECYSSLPGRESTFFPIRWADASQISAKPFFAHTTFDLTGENYVDSKRTVAIKLSDTKGFVIKANTPNDQQQNSLQDCGNALLPLGDALAEMLNAEKHDVKKANEALAQREFVVPLTFSVYNEKDGSSVVKGVLKLSGVRAYMWKDGPLRDAPLRLDLERDAAGAVVPRDEFAYGGHNEPFFAAAMNALTLRGIYAFTEDAMAQGIGFAASSEEVKRVHAPFFATESGQMPGSAFVLKAGPLAPSPADEPEKHARVQAWMKKIAGYALARINQSEKWFIDTVTAQLARTDNVYDPQFTECANLFGQILAIPATSMPYVSDEVRIKARKRIIHMKTRNGYVDFKASGDPEGVHAVERFSEQAKNDGGDCEDAGMFENRIAMTLRAGKWSDPLVAAVGRMAQQFVPVVNLGSVRDASVGNDLSDMSKLRGEDTIDSIQDRSQKYGAHMWCEQVPVARFAALVQRSVPDVDHKLLTPDGYVGAPWQAWVPHLVVEGTGRIESLMLPRVAYTIGDAAAKQAVVDETLKRKELIGSLLTPDSTFSKMQMVREAQDASLVPNKRVTKFYRDATHAFTAAYADSLGVIDFVWAQKGPRVPAPASIGKLDAANPLFASLRCLNDTTSTIAAPAVSVGDDAPVDFAAWTESAAPAVSVGDDAPVDFAAWTESAAHHSAKQLVAPELDGMRIAMQLVTRHCEEHKTLFAASADGAPKHEYAYGAPLEDRIYTPLLPAIALVPGPRLSARETRYIGEIMRHAPPVNTPGDWKQIQMMHEASIESRLVNNKDDEALAIKAESEKVDQLQASLRKALGTESGKDWPKRGSHVGKWTLATFEFPTSALTQPGAVEAVTADVFSRYHDGKISFARLLTEEAMPYRRLAVLQLLLNPKESHAAASIEAQKRINARLST